VIADMRPSLIAFARRFYEVAGTEMQGSAGFIDASAVLNDHPGDVFHDLGHVSAFGVPIVGEFIATGILAQMDDDAAANLAEDAAAPAPERP
jgi:hypothetical protein